MHRRKLKINIVCLDNNDKKYMAYYESECLNANYCVVFKDNIMGALALHRFSEMVKYQSKAGILDFVIIGNEFNFKSQAIIDTITQAFHITGKT